MRIASFFAGIGGFDLGLAHAGHEIVYACELDPFARSVYAARFAREPEGMDICAVRPEEIQDAELWCGGFPCQNLSTAGRRSGIDGDRSGLIWRLLDLAAVRKPQWLLLENVPGLLSGRDEDDAAGDSEGEPGVGSAGDPTWFGRLLGALADLGYVGAWRVLDARFFGVPQRRRRIFILARRAGDGPCPREVLLEPEGMRRDPAPGGAPGQSVAGTLGGGSGSRGWSDDLDRSGAFVTAVTAKLAKGTGGPSGDEGRHLVLVAFNSTAESGRGGNGWERDVAPPVRVGSGPSAVVLAVNSRDEPRVMDVAGAVPARPGGMKQAQFVAYRVNAAESCAKRDHAQKTDYARALDPTGGFATNQGGTIVASDMLVRRLTPRECERLQGFPDDWTLIPWRGKQAPDSLRYKAVGNAVAVPVIKWIGWRLASVVEGRSS